MSSPTSPAAAASSPGILIHGQPVSGFPLRHQLSIGRGEDAGVQIADRSVSRLHCQIEKVASGWQVTDLGSRSGTLINGRLFQQQVLIYGDALQIGSVVLRFEGRTLELVSANGGARLEAAKVHKAVGPHVLLHSISLVLKAGKFAGILGSSGAGKSTLLDGLSGVRPVNSGEIRIAGLQLDAFKNQGPSACGYVPQDDIVHTALTVREAVRFSARMRLPGDLPQFEIDKVVSQTLHQLGLTERAELRIHRLSGGQRKRVSIATEVLARPSILFLDEPSSGLDPATEFKLMELLRELANLGCTILCTTHVMENVYLFDQLIVVSAGRLAYSGPPSSARDYFQIERFSSLYERLGERPAQEWEARAAAIPLPAAGENPLRPQSTSRRKASPFFRIQIERQWAILKSDPKNLALLLGQPLLIGLLIAAMADDQPFKLFFSYLATLWFGCSNAAQEIVKEITIYRRERNVGLGRNAYLLSKFVFLGAITLAQSAVLYGCMFLGGHFSGGSSFWQIACLIATAACGVGIGTAISAISRSITQAAMVVPLVLLPLIVLSGFVLSPFRIKPDGSVSKRAIYAWVPSHAAQTMMDVSLFKGERLTNDFVRINDPTGVRGMIADPEQKVLLGDVFEDDQPAVEALEKLAAWTLISYLVALGTLASKERVS